MTVQLTTTLTRISWKSGKW